MYKVRLIPCAVQRAEKRFFLVDAGKLEAGL